MADRIDSQPVLPIWSSAITLGDLLLRAAHDHPDRPALAMADGSWTYGELSDKARWIARGLMALGVSRGDAVGFLLPNSEDCVATLFGAALAGARVVPVNARFKSRELRYLAENAGRDVSGGLRVERPVRALARRRSDADERRRARREGRPRDGH